MSQSKASSSHKKHSVIEEDIEGASYDQDGFDSYSGSLKKPLNKV
jgi:hypothetical protein